MSARYLSIAVLSLAALALCACGGAQARKARHIEKGQSYLAAGNVDKARVEFQNALQIAPTDPEARFEMGVVDEKLGKVRDAARFYQATIDVSREHLGAHTNLARLYVYSGAPDRALELIKPVLDTHPDDSELLALRAAARVQQKDLAGAQVDAERAVQLNPKNEDAVATLAGVYTSTKAVDKATSLLEDSIKTIPATVDLRLALVQVYAGANRTADVERILLDLVGLRPNEKAQRIRLAQFYARQNQLDPAERVLREAIKAIPQDRELKLALIDFLANRRSPEVAEKELRAMIAADPKDVEMKFAQAKFYQDTRQPALAEKIYQEVIDSEKLDAAGLMARDRLAELRAQRNDVAGAQALIAEVLAKSPRDDDALVLRGTLALAQKDPKAAIADLRTVLRDQPNAIGVMRSLARAHLANGEPALAEETMRRAVESNPKDARIRLDLAQLLAQLGKPEQAKPIVADLVKDQPNNMPALDTLFRVSAAAKDYETARTAAEAMVATQPKSPVGYLYQGMLAEEAKHNEDALRLYSRAVELQPDGIEPLQAQVRLLVNTKRIPEAIKRLDEVAAQAPKSALAPNLKGQLLLAQGNPGEAQVAYKMAVERAPKWWVPYVGLAKALFAAKDPDAGLAVLRDAQSKVDEPDQLAFEMAAFFEQSGKLHEAMREYEDVLRRNPRSEVAANNLAMMLVTYEGDPASLDRAKSLSARFAESTNPSYLDTYGWVLFKHGEAAASVPILERVVSKAPDAPVALYHLGMAQSQNGSTAQAVGNLSRAVKSGAKFSGLDEAKATLDRLAKLPSEAAPKT
ncbi:MAG TPA: tetratricopeptide repeat protein [Steroidobacteraceae bacterium]